MATTEKGEERERVTRGDTERARDHADVGEREAKGEHV